MTKVIHIKDAPEGWKRNPDYVYIGRPSMWGNPYALNRFSREVAIKMFEDNITEDLRFLSSTLKDKTLVCYCKPQACHGDVLARLADS